MNNIGLGYVPAAENGSYPVRGGNSIKVHIDGEPSFRSICEAIEAASKSVWLTVAFIWPEFQFPDGRGSLFDVLDRAVARGLDVRVIFWRPNPETASYESTTFSGTADQRAMLASRGSRFRIRWDRPFKWYANHSKSWAIDIGQPGERAFVGGSNLNPNHLGIPGHANFSNHDLYLEIAGPSVVDIHHNFAQRWNEASERHLPDGTWGHMGRDDDLPFPTATPLAVGAGVAQVQRTIHPGRYLDGRTPPEGRPFFIASGEHSIFEQYLTAIGAARRTIYIEHQAITVLPVVSALKAALERGVLVVALVPGLPESGEGALRRNPAYVPFYEVFDSLAQHDNFALVGLAVADGTKGRRFVYVHSKAMLVDDLWMTVGSCNLHEYSCYGSAEMNVSVWDPTAVRSLRTALLQEHLGQDTSHLDDRAAFGLFGAAARRNRQKWDAGNIGWEGSVVSLDPKTYGKEDGKPVDSH